MSTPESADQPLHVTKPVDINKLHIEEIDPYGDLILHVGADLDLTPRTFKVDSSALRRGSPVFKKMLFGPWVEAKPPTGERWLVSLPEDNPDALELILQIAHCQFSSAQKERMTPERVYDLFLVSDKYGMAPLLAPWIHWWGKFARHSVYQTQFAFDWGLCPFRGFIAWEVGLSEEFRFHLYHVVNTCRIDPKSNVLVFDGDQGKEMPVSQYRLGPVDMDDRIAEGRRSRIQSMLDAYYHEIDSRIPDAQGTSLSSCSDADCDAKIVNWLLWMSPTKYTYAGLDRYNYKGRLCPSACDINLSINKFHSFLESTLDEVNERVADWRRDRNGSCCSGELPIPPGPYLWADFSDQILRPEEERLDKRALIFEF